MREIAVVTVGRSDFGIYLPLLRAIRSHPDLTLRILASGMHLSPEFGLTVRDIEAAGFEVFEKVESLTSSDSPEGVAKTIGLGVLGFAQVFARYRPGILLLLGDRFDMLPAALAALPFRIPMAHLHGGESTEGAIDESIRHCLTKLSHLHFPSTQVYADRIVQMGEEPWRVTVSGAPALDAIREAKLEAPADTARHFGFSLDAPVALVTVHPETLDYERTEAHVSNLLGALDKLGMQAVFTAPNADTGGRLLRERIEGFCAGRARCRFIPNVGQQGYFNLMNTVSVMVGNSSSGIIEAASFRLPVVNIGQRQAGRLRASNVIDCGHEISDIMVSIQRGLSPAFRAALTDLVNPYGDGRACGRIVEKLATVPLDETLIVKRFYKGKGSGGEF